MYPHLLHVVNPLLVPSRTDGDPLLYSDKQELTRKASDPSC